MRRFIFTLMVVGWLCALSGCAVMSAVSDLDQAGQMDRDAFDRFQTGDCKAGLALIDGAREVRFNALTKIEKFRGQKSDKVLSDQDKEEYLRELEKPENATITKSPPVNFAYSARCSVRMGNTARAVKEYPAAIRAANFWRLNGGMAMQWAVSTIDGVFARNLSGLETRPTKEDWRNVVQLLPQLAIEPADLLTYMAAVKSPELLRQINLDIAVQYADLTPEQKQVAWEVFNQRESPIDERQLVAALLTKLNKIKEIATVSPKFTNVLGLNRDKPQVLEPGEVFVDFTIVGDQVVVAVFDGKVFQHVRVQDAPSLAEHVQSYRMLHANISFESLIDARADVFDPATSMTLWEKDGSWWVSQKRKIPSDAKEARAENYSQVRKLALAQHAQWLTNTLLRSISNSLLAADKLIFAPDNILATMPWAALLAQSGLSKQGTPIVITHSLSVYTLLNERAKLLTQQNAQQTKQLKGLVVANPKYDAVNHTVKRTNVRNVTVQESSGKNSLIIPPHLNYADAYARMQRLKWSNLQGAEQEGQEVANMLGANLLKGADATKLKVAEYLKVHGSKLRYLHFATHGYLDNDFPSYSAIVLGRSGTSIPEDGYLTAWEIPELNLTAELVVLSACETGLGVTRDSDGVMGLPYALFLAGAGKSMVTLWPVDDEATRIFMLNFWKIKLQGIGSAKALAQTQLAFAKGEFGNRYMDASYWGAFALYGSLAN